MLTPDRIIELAQGEGVKAIAVENFLSTLGDLTHQEAVANCELDARSYRWSQETSAAIRIGLCEHFRPEGLNNPEPRS